MQNKGIIYIFMTVVFFTALVPLSMAVENDYYLSTAGNDSDAGTTIETAWGNLSYACEQLEEGDTLYIIDDGIYYNDTCTFANSGNETHPITITAYNGTPMFTGLSTIDFMYIFAKNNIHISRLKASEYKRGAALRNNITGITIENMTITDTADNGIMLYELSNPFAQISDVTINNVTLQTIGKSGIDMHQEVNSTDITISNITITGAMEYGIIAMYTRNLVIKNARIINTGLKELGYEAIDLEDRTRDAILENIYIDGTSWHGIDIRQVVGGNELENITLRNIEVYRADQCGIYLHSGVSNCLIDGFKIHDSTALAAGIQMDATNITIQNGHIYNMLFGLVLYGSENHADNVTITNNILGYPIILGTDNTELSNMRVSCSNEYSIYTVTSSNITVRNSTLGEGKKIKITGTGCRIIDPIDKRLNIEDNDINTTIINTDGRIWTGRTSGQLSCHNNRSEYTGNLAATIYRKNMSVRPTEGYLYNITVYSDNKLSMRSSETENPTLFRLETGDPDSVYIVKSDTETIGTNSTDENGVLYYFYNATGDDWTTEHLFEFISQESLQIKYYLSTSGSDLNSGTSLSQAWGNLSYACEQLEAGSTLYIIDDGIYYNHTCTLANSGNVTDPITITAYNGTPILDGVDGSGYAIYGGQYSGSWTYTEYLNINGITIRNYQYYIYSKHISHMTISDNTIIFNYTLTNQTLPGQSPKGIYLATNTSNSIVSGNTIIGDAWNSLSVSGDIEATKNNTITGNIIKNNYLHACIDLSGNITDISITDNNLINCTKGPYNESGSAIYAHETTGYPSGYIHIMNNLIHNSSNGITFDDPLNNSIIEENTIYGLDSPETNYGHHIKITDTTSNITISNNTMYGNAYGYMVQANIVDSLIELDNITREGTDTEYRFLNTIGAITLRDVNNNNYRTYSVLTSSQTTIEYTQNYLFDGIENINYTSSRSYATFSTGTKSITRHPMTATPIYDYLNITINTINQTQDIWNITLTSSVAENPTLFTVETLYADRVYTIKRDSQAIASETADGNGILAYSYNATGDDWTTGHTFEFVARDTTQNSFYLSTVGSDMNTGTSIYDAWGNLSYACSQLEPGDTLYIMDDGVYYNHTCWIEKTGNQTHQIRIMPYDGIPTFDGTTREGDFMKIGVSEPASYVNISGLNITRYENGIYFNNRVSNVEVRNFAISDCNRSGIMFLEYYDNISLHDFNISNIGGYTIDYCAAIYHYIFYGHSNDIEIYNFVIDNTVGQCRAIWYQDVDRIHIHDGEIYDIDSYGIVLGPKTTNSLLENLHINRTEISGISMGNGFVNSEEDYLHNNTIRNCEIGMSEGDAIMIFQASVNTTIEDSILWRPGVSGINYLWTGTDLNVRNVSVVDSYFQGFIIKQPNAVIRDSTTEGTYQEALYLKSENVTVDNCNLSTSAERAVHIKDAADNYTLNNTRVGDDKFITVECGEGIFKDILDNTYKIEFKTSNITLRYTDNKLFSINDNQYVGSQAYMTNGSYKIIENPTDTFAYINVTRYPMSVIPTSGELNITVNSIIPGLGIWNITLESSEAENPTLFRLEISNISRTYTVKRDGAEIGTNVTDENGILTYFYDDASDDWAAAHTFEFVEQPGNTYYLSVYGSDSNLGATVASAWGNLSYACEQLEAGDTLYVIDDGVYYNHTCTLSNSGNETHPITITAYNGKPMFDGVDQSGAGIMISNSNWTVIDGLEVYNYSNNILTSNANNITIMNCVSHHSGGNAIHISSYSNGIIIDRCIVHNAGWNGITLYGNRDPREETQPGNGIPNINMSIRNCEIFNCTVHNCIDLYGTIREINIDNNTIYNSPYSGIYSHSGYDTHYNMTISNNRISDTLYGMNLENIQNTTVINNTISDVTRNGIVVITYSGDVSFINNTLDCDSTEYEPFQAGTFDIRYISNNLLDRKIYRFNGGTGNVVRDARNEQYAVRTVWGGGATVEYTTGMIFTPESGTPRYYPDKSNASVPIDENYFGISTYPIYIRPTGGYLTAAINGINKSTDTWDVTITSSWLENPTLFTLETLYPETTYTVIRDSASFAMNTTDENGVLTYLYNDPSDDWAIAHNFVFSRTVAVTLESPEDGIYTNNGTVIFNCSGETLNALANITFWGNWSGTWEANETRELTGSWNSTIFEKNVSEGMYVWNCRAFDNEGISAFSPLNRTLTVDLTEPNITVNSPANLSTLAYTATLATLNISTDEIAYCRYNISADFNFSESANFNVTGSTAHVMNISVSAGNTYRLYYKCNDTAGNVNTDPLYHTFSVAAVPVETPTSGGGGSSGGGSGGAALPVPVDDNETVVDNQITGNVIRDNTTHAVNNTDDADDGLRDRAEALIEEVKGLISEYRDTKDMAEAENKLLDAIHAFDNAEYEDAIILAMEAKELALNAPDISVGGDGDDNGYLQYIWILAVVAIIAIAGYLMKNRKRQEVVSDNQTIIRDVGAVDIQKRKIDEIEAYLSQIRPIVTKMVVENRIDPDYQKRFLEIEESANEIRAELAENRQVADERINGLVESLFEFKKDFEN